MSVCVAPSPTALSPIRPAVVAPADPAGRHRRAESTLDRIGRVFDLAARMGSIVTLAALLVVAGTAAGLAGGTSGDDIPTVTVTFDHSGR